MCFPFLTPMLQRAESGTQLVVWIPDGFLTAPVGRNIQTHRYPKQSQPCPYFGLSRVLPWLDARRISTCLWGGGVEKLWPSVAWRVFMGGFEPPLIKRVNPETRFASLGAAMLPFAQEYSSYSSCSFLGLSLSSCSPVAFDREPVPGKRFASRQRRQIPANEPVLLLDAWDTILLGPAEERRGSKKKTRSTGRQKKTGCAHRCPL